MPRPDLTRVPDHFHGYINQVAGDDLVKALQESAQAFVNWLDALPENRRDYRYGPDKWTVREVVQHIVDAERIFAYRALCFARKDQTSLPSFDENSYADHSKAAQRNWDELLNEFKLLRQSNELLFSAMDDEQLDTFGTANNRPMNARAVGFTMAGHVNHHLRILKERYSS